MAWQPLSPAEVFVQCQSSDSLLRSRQAEWIVLAQQYLQHLQPLTEAGQLTRILLVHKDPIEFLAGLMAAFTTECPIFLGNPNWSVQEWLQVLALVQPHHVWGTPPGSIDLGSGQTLNTSDAPDDASQRGWIMIPTGGSSGGIKFAIHSWQTLSAAVSGFQTFFGDGHPVNSCCVLPLYHVSGLMQFLRALLTGGQLVMPSFTEVLSGQSLQPDIADFLVQDSIQPAAFFLSLVPTQLQRLLEVPTRLPWLQRFPTIFLGGAPAWTTLLDQAIALSLNLAPTYGMTETAAQVATLRPVDFLQGQRGVGHPLPHAQITIQNLEGEVLQPHQSGIVVIQAQSLFQGYYPHYLPRTDWITDDIGFLDVQGYLSVVGRNSRKILSGGENIFPEEVEATLYSSGLLHEVCVLGLPDPEWGEVVTVLYVPSTEAQSQDVLRQQLTAVLDRTLSRYKHPKRWIQVERLPRSAQGKLNYQSLARWVSEMSESREVPD